MRAAGSRLLGRPRTGQRFWVPVALAGIAVLVPAERRRRTPGRDQRVWLLLRARRGGRAETKAAVDAIAATIGS